uniref:hypothetical protein n=1 Tax=Ensifer adhaerens TaxID=106592 RepID=UPI003F494FE5
MVARITVAEVGGREVHARDFVKGSPICRHCKIGLVHVNGVTRRDGTIGDAFYRKAAGSAHVNCKYDEGTRVMRIVRFSIGFTGHEPIVVNQGRATFQLDIIADALRRNANEMLPPAIRNGNENILISAERVQTQSLRTAKAILGLASRIDNTRELAEIVSISRSGQIVRWNQFFYGSEAAQRLFQSASAGIHHPVAIAVRVRNVLPPAEGQLHYMIGCYGAAVTDEGIQLRLSPTLRTTNARLAELFTPDQWYLVLGQPTSLGGRGIYRNLNLLVHSRHQVCKYEPELTR